MIQKVFKCQRCNQCCEGRGGIKIYPNQVKDISSYLKMAAKEFLKHFCQIKNEKIYIKTNKERKCILLNPKKGCLIHNLKPNICRRWPFFKIIIKDQEAFEEAKQACPGINSKITHKQFKKIIEEYNIK